MAARGGVQVVKTHGEPVYVNSLPAGPMHAGRGRPASEWETEAPGKRRCRCCPTAHACTLCLIALLLAGLLALALLAYLPTELYWQDGQLKFHSKIKVVDTPAFEMHKGEIPTETPVWWLTTKPPKKALLPVAHVILKLPDSKNEDHAETALIWACDTSESVLRGGISCASNDTVLRVPTLGMYIAHAQVTMTCKQSGGKVGVLPSARLLAGSNSREMALAHLSGCVRNEGYATMQLRRICELVAGDEVSVMVTHAWRLHGAFKLTYFDLHLLPAHQD